MSDEHLTGTFPLPLNVLFAKLKLKYPMSLSHYFWVSRQYHKGGMCLSK